MLNQNKHWQGGHSPRRSGLSEWPCSGPRLGRDPSSSTRPAARSSPDMTIGGIDLAPGNALAVGSHPAHRWEDLSTGLPGECFWAHRPQRPARNPAGSHIELPAHGGRRASPRSSRASMPPGPWRRSRWRLPSRPNSFFELYYNPAVVANNLAGTGFNVGTLILAGNPSTTAPSVGIFSLSTSSTGTPSPRRSTSFITNHYPGITTVAGSGSALLSSDVTNFDPDFFKTPL